MPEDADEPKPIAGIAIGASAEHGDHVTDHGQTQEQIESDVHGNLTGDMPTWLPLGPAWRLLG